MMATAAEIQTQIDAKRARVAAVLEKTKTDQKHADSGEPIYDFSKADADWLGKEVIGIADAGEKAQRVASAIIAETTELNALAEHMEGLSKAQRAAGDFHRDEAERDRDKKTRGPGHPDSKDEKSLGQQIAEQIASKWRGSGWGHGPTIQLPDASLTKTLFQTSAGWVGESTRTGRVVDAVVRPEQLLDILPKANTGQPAVVYMEETTHTNSAAGVAEGAQKPESAYALTERSVAVKEIATTIPVTEIQLEDVPMVESWLEGRLRQGIRDTLDEHCMDNGGGSNTVTGILNNGSIQTQAQGADSFQDAILKAMSKVRLSTSGGGGAVPTHVGMSTLDWETLRLTRESSGSGMYLWGPPSEAGPMRVWGLPIFLNDILTNNVGQDRVALVGSFELSWIGLFERRGVVVDQGWVNDQFRENRRTIRASGRWALVIFRPPAFIKITSPALT
jgi:HK97 family phage major capsid protein